MYFVLMFILMVLVGVFGVMQGINALYWFDTVTILMMFLLIIPMFLASGMGKQFKNIVLYMCKSKKNFERNDYRKMLEATNLLIKLSIFAGVFTSITGLLCMLQNLSDPAQIGPALTVVLLALIYSAFLLIILYPIQAKLKIELIDES